MDSATQQKRMQTLQGVGKPGQLRHDVRQASLQMLAKVVAE